MMAINRFIAIVIIILVIVITYLYMEWKSNHRKHD